MQSAVMVEADVAYAAGRFAAALALYEEAARQGNAGASEMAGYMLFFGPALFGPSIPCDHARARAWLEAPAGAGRLVARMLIDRIDRGLPVPAFHPPPPKEPR
jgi:TPR repeat protein